VKVSQNAVLPPHPGRTAGPPPTNTAALLRHFADLRAGTHGDAVSRQDKERLFATAVPLLDPYARQALDVINAKLLLGAGQVDATGVRARREGVDALWMLSWPEQRAADINPIILNAFYGSGFHHPLRPSPTGTPHDSPCVCPSLINPRFPTYRSIFARSRASGHISGIPSGLRGFPSHRRRGPPTARPGRAALRDALDSFPSRDG
jgi:hypothetical protein